MSWRRSNPNAQRTYRLPLRLKARKVFANQILQIERHTASFNCFGRCALVFGENLFIRHDRRIIQPALLALARTNFATAAAALLAGNEVGIANLTRGTERLVDHAIIRALALLRAWPVGIDIARHITLLLAKVIGS